MVGGTGSARCGAVRRGKATREVCGKVKAWWQREVRPRKIRSRRGENPSQPWKDLWKEFVGNGGTSLIVVIDCSGNFPRQPCSDSGRVERRETAA